MDATAVTVRNISKMYRLYHSRGGRLLDFFSQGFGRRRYEEFWALEGVSFEIPRGTTVGIIGRNGAGKSTLLRIMTGNTTPTSGDVRLNGRVSAILEIGTGFHPELTGKQNVYASGMYLGMTREEIDPIYDDIVAFSELGDFIEQPVKTYSAGMYMRLAFAVSTAIHPDILLIDEALGVGDAYFSRKCAGRIRTFLETDKTVLIVSHDLGTLQRLCGRLLWIEQGKLVMDGAPLEVLKAYAASIRSQEESRLRAKATAFNRDQHAVREKGLICGSGEIIITQVRSLDVAGHDRHIFAAGEPLTFQIRYQTCTPVADPVFAVSVYRMDGITICQSISSFNEVNFGKLEGTGIVELLITQPSFGPGHYVVSVAILPYVDPLGRNESTPYDLHSRLYEFKIDPPLECAIDLGLVLQPVTWKHRPGGPAGGENHA